MSTYTETVTQTQPALMIRLRRLSKTAFISESNSKSPRLDKMIAHVNLFDKVTQRMEQELEQEKRLKAVVRRVRDDKPRARPQIVRRVSREKPRSEHVEESTVTWNPEGIVVKPQENCVYVTETQEVEVDDDT